MPPEKASDPVMFQTIMMALQDFWSKQGCLIWQPYYTQVGAGTNNPATFLRVLGPEPWNVAYIEPSVRPDDGRYGENPNRFQLHYQFQVILKPDPGNPQELYLESLKALGIDPREHDIRFVEDNWEQPTIAAWGLGWEVWLDGQEITQFTYFQQVGGQTLDPVAVEITYGLDRILIALNNASAIWNEPWGAGVRYGELRQQEEFEHSKYYFEVADVARVRQIFSLFEEEAEACLKQSLVLPAYDYVLKCSHAFNVLDCRGAIGVTERQAFFGRVRDLARRVAAAYLEQRQHLEYPLLKDDREAGLKLGAKAGALEETSALPGTVEARESEAPQPFLFEIGTEELPAGDLEAALEQLRQRVPAMLDELRLAHGEVRVLGTPRRLVVWVSDLATRQFDEEQVFKGPPANRAYDALGQPNQAAEGFARSKGVTVSDLQVREIDGGRYMAAVVKFVGKPALEVLSEALPGLAAGIKFERSMRWNQTNVSFSRPVRWLVALLGKRVVPCEFAGSHSSNVTRGLRPNDSPEIAIPEASQYFDVIRRAGILLETEERKNAIVSQVQALAAQAGGEAVMDPGLLAEVVNLVESPKAILGSFNPEYLSLPEEVLISVMKKHQRYFPVRKPAGVQGAPHYCALLPHFIVIRNGDSAHYSAAHMDLVRQGNEHVLGARFADANFFVRDDLKQRLEEFVPHLNTLMFQTKLGSMLDKTRRVQAITDALAPIIGLSAEETKVAGRAAGLCKADLATRMVVEMTSLQGIMGRFYALRSNEDPAVALAIFEHYLPRFAGDAVPASKAGLVVGLADRLDSLSGLFAVGLAPSGNKDPFGQRRTALGLVQNLISWNLDLDVLQGFETAAAQQPLPVEEAALQATVQFVIERLRNLLLEGGARFDHVDAVLAAQGRIPARVARAVDELAKWTGRPDWNTILPAYARCVRITRPIGEAYAVAPQAFLEPAEHALWAALQAAEAAPRAPGSVDDLLNAFLPMIPAINTFFEAILVMAPEPDIRQNRLGLLQRIAGLAEGVADMSRLEGF